MSGKGLFQKKKDRLFVSYDHYSDGNFYEAFSRLYASQYEIVRDNSLDRELDTQNEGPFFHHLNESGMGDAGCTVVLCGAHTHQSKFVDWEIKATLDRKNGLIGIVLPTNPAAEAAPSQAALPDRLRDSFEAGYAVLLPWRELADLKIDLTTRVYFARSRSPELIDNSRPLRRGNG